jgi:hypothetical protein
MISPEITAEDIGRQVRLQNGEIETIVEFYPDRLRPVIIKDAGGLFSPRHTDGRLNADRQRPEYDIVERLADERPAPEPEPIRRISTAERLPTAQDGDEHGEVIGFSARSAKILRIHYADVTPERCTDWMRIPPAPNKEAQP